MACRLINKEDIKDIFDYVAYFEYKYGNLNFYFSSIFDGIFDYKELLELGYLYDKINGLSEDVDEEEYFSRYENLSFEKHLEKLKQIGKDVYYAINDKRYKPNYGKHEY